MILRGRERSNGCKLAIVVVRWESSVLEIYRAELKAIQGWDERDFPIATWTEQVAISIRRARRVELIAKICEIAVRN